MLKSIVAVTGIFLSLSAFSLAHADEPAAEGKAKNSGDYSAEKTTVNPGSVGGGMEKIQKRPIEANLEVGGFFTDVRGNGTADADAGGGLHLGGTYRLRKLVTKWGNAPLFPEDNKVAEGGLLWSPGASATFDLNFAGKNDAGDSQVMVDRAKLDATLGGYRIQSKDTIGNSDASLNWDANFGNIGATMQYNGLIDTGEIAPTLSLGNASAHARFRIKWTEKNEDTKQDETKLNIAIEPYASVEVGKFGLGYSYNNGSHGFGSIIPLAATLGLGVDFGQEVGSLNEEINLQSDKFLTGGDQGYLKNTLSFNCIAGDKWANGGCLGVAWDHIRESAQGDIETDAGVKKVDDRIATNLFKLTFTPNIETKRKPAEASAPAK